MIIFFSLPYKLLNIDSDWSPEISYYVWVFGL